MFIANHQGPFQDKISWVNDFPVHIPNNNFRLGIFKMYNTSISYSPVHFSISNMNQEIIYVGTTSVSTYTITVATRMMIV
jgi:hypothetical protein